MFRSLLQNVVISLVGHTSHFRVFTLPTRRITLPENIAEVPTKCRSGKSLNGQIVQLSSFVFFVFFFSQASAVMAEAITMIPTRRSCIFNGVLHSHHSVSKESTFRQLFTVYTLEWTFAVERHEPEASST